MSAKKPSKKRQQQIPGTEDPNAIEDVDNAIAEYLMAMAERKTLQEQEKEAKAAVLKALTENKRQKYVYTDGKFSWTWTLDRKTKLKFKRELIEPAEAEEGDGETAEEEVTVN